MSCRFLKFSTQPELPLNLSDGIWKDLAIERARSRISWSVMTSPRSDHSWREFSIVSSISGNFEGLEEEIKSQILILKLARDGGIQGTCVSRTGHIHPLHLYSTTCPSP